MDFFNDQDKKPFYQEQAEPDLVHWSYIKIPITLHFEATFQGNAQWTLEWCVLFSLHSKIG